MRLRLAVLVVLVLALAGSAPAYADPAPAPSCGIGDVTTYGATGGDATDDTAAIQAAMAGAGGNPLCFPAGEYYFGETLTHTPGYVGASRQSTILRYTGTGIALSSPTPGARTYNTRVESLKLVDGGTGTVGLDMPCVSIANVNNVQVADFTTGVAISCEIDGGALYNVLTDVTVSGADIGFRIAGLSSNENRFYACRTNVTTLGVLIDGGNRNVFHGCAFESGTDGIEIVDDDSDRNQIISSRFENLSGFSVKVHPGVQGTVLAWNDRVSTAGAYQTANTDTTVLDNQPGGPALSISDLGDTTGDPLTLQIEVSRWSGTPLRVERTTDGVELLSLNGDGALRLRVVTSLPAASRAGAGALLVYDPPSGPPALILSLGSHWVYVASGLSV